jgi:hypothetical protein
MTTYNEESTMEEYEDSDVIGRRVVHRDADDWSVVGTCSSEITQDADGQDTVWVRWRYGERLEYTDDLTPARDPQGANY